MSSSKFSISTRVSSSYQQLSAVAADLNAVSDALSKAVSDIDEGLKKLNLGITAWVRVGSSYRESDLDATYEYDELGYAKANGRWGIAIRSLSGDGNRPEYVETDGEYPFNEAPRASRLRAIECIPELLNKLNQEAAKVTKDLRAKLADAQAVADAVQEAARERKGISGEIQIQFQATKPPAIGSIPSAAAVDSEAKR